MTSLVALVSGLGWHVEDLRRAAGRLGVSLHTVLFPRVRAVVGTRRDDARVSAGDLDLTAADGVLVRMMPPGSLEQVVFRMDALHRVAAAGVPVLNPPRAVETAVDKYLTLALIEAAGLLVPPTWVGESATAALDAFEALGSDDGREVACALDLLRQDGRLGRDRDGRYHLGSSRPGVTGIIGQLYHDPNEGT